MTTEIFIRYLHFISIFAIVGALVSEHLLLKDRMTGAELRRMARLDAVYGLAAIVTVGAGVVLWFIVGKPADFYTHNWIFHIKVTLVVLLGLLSIAPTIFFIKNRKRENTAELVDIPAYVRWMLRLELLLLFLIPLCASLMAKGVGYFE